MFALGNSSIVSSEMRNGGFTCNVLVGLLHEMLVRGFPMINLKLIRCRKILQLDTGFANGDKSQIHSPWRVVINASTLNSTSDTICARS